MAPIATRWPVVVRVPIEPGDCDPAGALTEEAAARVFGVARDAYFEMCTTVGVADVEVRETSVQCRAVEAGERVSVSVNVVELFPDSFIMTSRIRPAEGDEIAADVRCSLAPKGGVTKAIRDEFIAIAHAARHMH